MSEQAIYVYLGVFDEIDRPTVRQACIETLSADEHERAQRFVRERDRTQFILAHGLVRTALSRHAPGIDPAGWRFVTDGFGRPAIAGPLADKLHFSLSHTDGCVACVVSPSKFVGVDVETIDRPCAHLEIAEFTFSPREIADLRALPGMAAISRFFDYWTLKEAYVKARGMGLRLPLDQFSMLIKSDREIGISFTPELVDDPDRWCFMLSSPGRGLRLALADGSGQSRRLPIVPQPWPIP
jgi:4'-phosphopantetheinyl transferase